MASLYLEKDHPCPYLEKELSRNLFFNSSEVTPLMLDRLLSEGWRHFGEMFFRPFCRGCRRCSGAVVDPSSFQSSKSQKRILNKNKDLSFEIADVICDQEHLTLLNQFQEERAQSRGWPLEIYTSHTYSHAFVSDASWAKELRIRDSSGKMIGVSIIDVGIHCQSSVYFYSDPKEAHRSLGTWSLLQEIFWAKREGRSEVYLGLYNDEAPSLSYKAKFKASRMIDYNEPERDLIQWIQQNL